MGAKQKRKTTRQQVAEETTIAGHVAHFCYFISLFPIIWIVTFIAMQTVEMLGATLSWIAIIIIGSVQYVIVKWMKRTQFSFTTILPPINLEQWVAYKWKSIIESKAVRVNGYRVAENVPDIVSGVLSVLLIVAFAIDFMTGARVLLFFQKAADLLNALLLLLAIMLALGVFVLFPFSFYKAVKGVYQHWVVPLNSTLQAREAYKQALQQQRHMAVKRVTPTSLTQKVTLVDIGLVVYETDTSKPYISRMGAISRGVAYIRPFVELNAAWRKVYTVTLELVDDSGEILFSEASPQRISGKTVLLPTGRLGLAQYDFGKEKEWSLRVRIEGELFAIHLFEWDQLPREDSLTQRRMDGEISAQISRLIADDQLTSLSLDDLLADQPQ